MEKLKISKNKKKSSEPSEGADSEDKNKEEGEDEEEVIVTTNNKNKPKAKRSRAKKLNTEFMNSEKEKYLSMWHNAADLISSSSSDTDEEDDEFEVDAVAPESDSNSEEVSSLKHSSQYSDNPVTESASSQVEQSHVSKGTSGKKRVTYSSIVSYSSHKSKRKVSD